MLLLQQKKHIAGEEKSELIKHVRRVGGYHLYGYVEGSEARSPSKGGRRKLVLSLLGTDAEKWGISP